MQQYQSYYPQMQQPMMFNNNMQYNPYAERLAQLQAQQQQMQQSVMPTQIPTATQGLTPLGKIIENVDVLRTLEVPMDGNAYYFPKADGSEVYTKQWLPNGTTRILTFKPILDDMVDENTLEQERLNVEQFNKVVEGILNEIQTINSKIDKISKPSTTTRAKKEVVEDA